MNECIERERLHDFLDGVELVLTTLAGNAEAEAF